MSLSATKTSQLKAPYPWFGGKSRAAHLIWERFGQVRNFVDPFAGSMAALLNRPLPFEGVETANDKDGYICNFWRAIRYAKEEVAEHASGLIHECDLHARHAWLVNHREDITRKLEGDPKWYDAEAAGWWVWGLCLWIGSGWCSGNGPWQVTEDTEGVRKLVHLGDSGRGVNRKLVHLGNSGQGVNRQREDLLEYFAQLSDRLRNVRVCCGDWKRVTGPSVTFKHGLTAVFLDPPYSAEAGRADDLYAKEDYTVAHEVREWAIANGDNPQLRVCVAGYENEHQFPDDWECVAWKPRGGYDGQRKDGDNDNRERERLWFSPHCVKPELPLFAAMAAD